jgi:hypothetical protein
MYGVVFAIPGPSVIGLPESDEQMLAFGLVFTQN